MLAVRIQCWFMFARLAPTLPTPCPRQAHAPALAYIASLFSPSVARARNCECYCGLSVNCNASWIVYNALRS
ncbi:hypothetical protein B0T26DRAFT_715820 [Lasiosphaeria miniovina]|uniref:Secreted protein n=1 Tax=Lasiosphaeria miniovina TaxID=1954250 RepID=A0AA40ABR6_9PEZI|nr:uncharacterized protein B0T26DRAFT_715820 [Lasiosphaeria miniovina]KAK0712977.1 hypothetical protein B0T26DRAFT_715820 [Lasiosphaeria miniovina]